MTDDLHESTFCVTRPIRKNQSHACGICMYWIGQSHNLLPWKVSNWQFPMQHVTKISSKSRFLFSAIQLIWLDRKDSIAHSQEQWCYIFFLWIVSVIYSPQFSTSRSNQTVSWYTEPCYIRTKEYWSLVRVSKLPAVPRNIPHMVELMSLMWGWNDLGLQPHPPLANELICESYWDMDGNA